MKSAFFKLHTIFHVDYSFVVVTVHPPTVCEDPRLLGAIKIRCRQAGNVSVDDLLEGILVASNNKRQNILRISLSIYIERK